MTGHGHMLEKGVSKQNTPEGLDKEKGGWGKKYIHDLMGPVQSISGSYELEMEGIMEVDGKQVLYVVGNAVADSSCCGAGGCRYALVPGHIRKLKVRHNGNGLWVSEVEPISDGATRQEITRLLKEKELVQQVQFV